MAMSFLFRLILSHVIGDFALQTVDLVILKASSWKGLLLHTLIVTASAAVLFWTDLPAWGLWLIPLFVLHLLTDWGKVRLSRRFPQRPITFFLLDQAVHLLVILAIVVLQYGGWPYGSLSEAVAGRGSAFAANRDLLFLLAFLAAFFIVPLLESLAAGKWMRTFAQAGASSDYAAPMRDRLWGGAERTLFLLLLYAGGLPACLAPLAFLPRLISLLPEWREPQQARLYRVKVTTSIFSAALLGGLLWLAARFLPPPTP